MPMILAQTTSKFLFAVMFVMLIASSMSTLSSLVLVSASTFTEDILKGLFKSKISEKKNLLLMKTLCVVFIAASVIIALVPNPIITLLSLSWGTIAAAFIAPFLYALYGKTEFAGAAAASSVAGVGTMLGCVLIWGKANATYFACIAVLASFAALALGIAVCKARAAKPVPAECNR